MTRVKLSIMLYVAIRDALEILINENNNEDGFHAQVARHHIGLIDAVMKSEAIMETTSFNHLAKKLEVV